MKLFFQETALSTATLGPAEEFRIVHEGIFDASRQLARHRDGYWEIDGLYFTAGRAEGRACVHAERSGTRTQAHGPV